VKKILILVSTTVVLATQAFGYADGPDSWRVTSVAFDDTLNFRVGPGTEYPVLGALPYDADEMQTVVCTPTITREQFFVTTQAFQDTLNDFPRWCLVTWQDVQQGWVNARFLTASD
jgi:hypothetical protein